MSSLSFTKSSIATSTFLECQADSFPIWVFKSPSTHLPSHTFSFLVISFSFLSNIFYCLSSFGNLSLTISQLLINLKPVLICLQTLFFIMFLIAFCFQYLYRWIWIHPLTFYWPFRNDNSCTKNGYSFAYKHFISCTWSFVDSIFICMNSSGNFLLTISLFT